MAERLDADRVRARTPAPVNEWLDHCTAERIEDFATRSSAEIDEALARLDRAWTLEQVVAAGLGTVVLAAAALGLRRRGWLAVAAAAGASLVAFTATGAGPGVVPMRRLGLRTRREVDCERCALKALRGDFELVGAARSPIAQAGNALQAALR